MIAPIPEIQVAVKFIVSCMYGKLPRRRADLFAEELSAAIQTKFQVRVIYLKKNGMFILLFEETDESTVGTPNKGQVSLG